MSPLFAADLVSINPLVDNNCTITYDKEGGCICHNPHSNFSFSDENFFTTIFLGRAKEVAKTDKERLGLVQKMFRVSYNNIIPMISLLNLDESLLLSVRKV